MGLAAATSHLEQEASTCDSLFRERLVRREPDVKPSHRAATRPGLSGLLPRMPWPPRSGWFRPRPEENLVESRPLPQRSAAGRGELEGVHTPSGSDSPIRDR